MCMIPSPALARLIIQITLLTPTRPLLQQMPRTVTMKHIDPQKTPCHPLNSKLCLYLMNSVKPVHLVVFSFHCHSNVGIIVVYVVIYFVMTALRIGVCYHLKDRNLKNL
eukprot:2498944-Ditylum_brightwellii.AAC.2